MGAFPVFMDSCGKGGGTAPLLYVMYLAIIGVGAWSWVEGALR